MVVVIWFMYFEISGFMFEQIDQCFNGVFCDQFNDFIDMYDGGKFINELELRNVFRVEVSVVMVLEKV